MMILLIEDSKVHQTLFLGILHVLGDELDIRVVENVKDVGNYLNDVDVIVLDLHLSETVGLDSIDALIKLTTKPIIIWSGDADVALALECGKRGASAYILKTTSTEQLISMAACLLGNIEAYGKFKDDLMSRLNRK